MPRRPVAFIATSDPDAARIFYGDVMGLQLQDASPYALVYRDADIALRVQIVGKHAPPSYTVHGWEVSDLTREIEDLGRKGVVFLRFEGMEQDGSGVWTTPSGDRIAWFKDPCGNILSLTQFKMP